MTTVDRIIALSGSMPNPLAHRHWLELQPPQRRSMMTTKPQPLFT